MVVTPEATGLIWVRLPAGCASMIARMTFSAGAFGVEQFSLDQGVPEVPDLDDEQKHWLYLPNGDLMSIAKNPVGFW